MVIFGASGDLTSRKLIPALYRQFQRERLPKPTRIIGVARSPFSNEQWREQLATSTAQFCKRDFTRNRGRPLPKMYFISRVISRTKGILPPWPVYLISLRGEQNRHASITCPPCLSFTS